MLSLLYKLDDIQRMKETYIASYLGKPSKKIVAFDAHSARKQAAYWFGCAVESDRLSVVLSQLTSLANAARTAGRSRNQPNARTTLKP